MRVFLLYCCTAVQLYESASRCKDAHGNPRQDTSTSDENGEKISGARTVCLGRSERRSEGCLLAGHTQFGDAVAHPFGQNAIGWGHVVRATEEVPSKTQKLLKERRAMDGGAAGAEVRQNCNTAVVVAVARGRRATFKESWD